MRPRLRKSLLAALALAASGAALVGGGAALLLSAPPHLPVTREAVARGRAVARARCLHCHATIPSAPRVAGWSPLRAYQAIGRLPELRPAMPPFAGSEAERRDLAVYLHALGAGDAPAP